MSSNPESDTVDKLTKFAKLFGPPSLLFLREDSNKNPNLMKMMTAFKVPVGVNETEAAKMKYYFAEQKVKEKTSRLAFWKKSKSLDDAADGYLNDHSRAIYLMAPDNKFLAFYSLDLSEHELATQLVEDISYDFGISHIGTKNTPLQGHETLSKKHDFESYKLPK